jgi:hypothetical protein
MDGFTVFTILQFITDAILRLSLNPAIACNVCRVCPARRAAL